MKLTFILIPCILSITSSVALTDLDFESQIKERYGDIYMGEPFLTAQRSPNDLWFELAGTLSKNFWQGYLNGFYKK